MKHKLLLILLCLSSQQGFAQQPYTLSVIPLDQDSGFVQDIYEIQRAFASPDMRDYELNLLLKKLYEEAYLMASFDSILVDSNHLSAYLRLGKPLQMTRLANGNIEEGVLNHVGFRERLFRNKPFKLGEILKLQERLLKYAENSGYPFANVKLDSFKMETEGLSAKVFLVRNQRIELDSIIIEGEALITNTYIYKYLGLKPGSLYDESAIGKISVRVKELPFLEEEEPTKVVFIADKARVYLYLKRKKASRFNFLIGFLPNAQSTATPTTASKFLITGDAQLHLHNPMGAGEVFKLEWKRYNQNTKLETNFLYPYLPSLPFGVEFDLEIFRQDTIYSDRTLGFGLHYLLVGGNYVKAYFSNSRSTLLKPDKTTIISTRRLPKNIDVEHNLYGIEYHIEKLDYKLNPRSGIMLEFNGGLGEKTIRKNSVIIALTDPNDVIFDFETLYDSVELQTIQYRLTYQFDKYWRLTGRSTLKTGITGGAFISKSIFQNELFRIGGNRLLRGFDEESVLAAHYHVLTLEWRLLLDQNSYFYVFTDGAWLENPTRATKTSDLPFGFGTGLTFETGAGIFTLSYALGRQLDNPIEFKSAKIHFGYLNYF